MLLDEYQETTRRTAVYPGAGVALAPHDRSEGERLTALTYLGLGLGEAGEIQGKLKKVIRDDHGVVTAERRESLVDELGDLLWYVARLADELGVSLSQVAQGNVDKLTSRMERGTILGSGDRR